MKKALIIAAVLGVWSCGSPSKTSLNWENKPLADVLENAKGQIIFAEFYTDW